MSASRKLDSSAIKKHFNTRRHRFATNEELLKLTGFILGAVPPFGKPIIDLELYVDHSIVEN